MVNFESDETAQEREIDYKTQEITELFRHAEGLLKRFSQSGSKESIPASELTVKTNIQRSIAKKLQGLSMSFRTTQKVAEFYLASLSLIVLISVLENTGISEQIESTKVGKWGYIRV